VFLLKPIQLLLLVNLSALITVYNVAIVRTDCVKDLCVIVMFACTGSFFTFVDAFTALRFPATGAPPAARRIQILPTNQYV
jgi:hypothetical protein